MIKQEITASVEDYLEVIYEHLKVNTSIKAVDISKKLNVSRASVTEALQKLSAKGYIDYRKSTPIQLTKEGEEIAKSEQTDTLFYANSSQIFWDYL